MTTSVDKIVCETPTPGKQPTRIDRWKYAAIREAILAVIGVDEVLFKELPNRVADQIPPAERQRIGSIPDPLVRHHGETRPRGSRRNRASPQNIAAAASTCPFGLTRSRYEWLADKPNDFL